jgi:uncharacterized membrane protein
VTDPADEPDGDPSGHIEQSVESIAAFHRDHYQGASKLQRVMDAATDRLGRPAFVAALLLGFGLWIIVSLQTTRGHTENPAFFWIELTATLAALVVALLILVTQRRQDQLAERRDQLTLELAILSDRKVAKVIALMEELRRDSPDLVDRPDAESEALAKPTNPSALLEALDRKTAKPGR